MRLKYKIDSSIINKNKSGGSIIIEFYDEIQFVGRVKLCSLFTNKKFNSNDYFQHTLIRQEEFSGKGFGDHVYSAIKEIKDLYPIGNVYSTNVDEDIILFPEVTFTKFALQYWERKVKLNQATYLKEFRRFFYLF